MKNLLVIKDLIVSIDNKIVINGLNLIINAQEIHTIMGPNGSGKSSLALTLMGYPGYIIKSGTITFDNQDISKLSPDKRARLGIFLSMQHPVEIEGVTYKNFLYQAYSALYRDTNKHLPMRDFYKLLTQQAALLNIEQQFLNRSINVGFSGGEKKRAEVLQLAMLKPKLAILDEIDSGLDIDSLKIVGNALKKIKDENPDISLIIITHYKRILDYIVPDFVHIMQNGIITKSGTIELAHKLEESGYQNT
ncbi:MAG: Fe-S cluster assembly ATPase SufC [bacterium]